MNITNKLRFLILERVYFHMQQYHNWPHYKAAPTGDGFEPGCKADIYRKEVRGVYEFCLKDSPNYIGHDTEVLINCWRAHLGDAIEQIVSDAIEQASDSKSGTTKRAMPSQFNAKGRQYKRPTPSYLETTRAMPEPKPAQASASDVVTKLANTINAQGETK